MLSSTPLVVLTSGTPAKHFTGVDGVERWWILAYFLHTEMTSGRTGRRQRFRGTPLFLLYIVGSRLLPGRKHLIPYSIQTLKRLKPEFFRQDLMTLFDLLKQKKIQPLIAQRFPLAQARQAQEKLFLMKIR
jgi:NADPH2:quinone reductase